MRTGNNPDGSRHKPVGPSGPADERLFRERGAPLLPSNRHAIAAIRAHLQALPASLRLGVAMWPDALDRRHGNGHARMRRPVTRPCRNLSTGISSRTAEGEDFPCFGMDYRPALFQTRANGSLQSDDVVRAKPLAQSKWKHAASYRSDAGMHCVQADIRRLQRYRHSPSAPSGEPETIAVHDGDSLGPSTPTVAVPIYRPSPTPSPAPSTRPTCSTPRCRATSTRGS